MALIRRWTERHPSVLTRSASTLSSSLAKIVGGVALAVLLLAAIAFVVVKLINRAREDDWQYSQSVTSRRPGQPRARPLRGRRRARDPGGHRGRQSRPPDRGGPVAVKPVRLIVAVAASARSRSCPAHSPPQWPVHGQDDPGLDRRPSAPATPRRHDHQLRHGGAHDRLAVAERREPRAVHALQRQLHRHDARPGSDEHLHRRRSRSPRPSPGRRPRSSTSPTTAAVTRPTSRISVGPPRGPRPGRQRQRPESRRCQGQRDQNRHRDLEQHRERSAPHHHCRTQQEASTPSASRPTRAPMRPSLPGAAARSASRSLQYTLAQYR